MNEEETEGQRVDERERERKKERHIFRERHTEIKARDKGRERWGQKRVCV